MGYDDTGKLKHENITFTRQDDGRSVVMLTITQDGKLLPGPGLTAEVATQQTAALLVKHYAVEINSQIHAAQREAAECQSRANRLEAELMAMSERAKEFEWQAREANDKLGDLMLAMVQPAETFTDEPK